MTLPLGRCLFQAIVPTYKPLHDERSEHRHEHTNNFPSEPTPGLSSKRHAESAGRTAHPWYTNAAPTFAGVFLWFVFWDSISANGLTAGGLWPSLVGIVIEALICHFLFYLSPGLLGMKTGLPLYVVGTSTFGSIGGLIMPGFLMGALQFGWLGVNTFGSATFLKNSFSGVDGNETLFYALCVLWAVGAAFVGLKGIQVRRQGRHVFAHYSASRPDHRPGLVRRLGVRLQATGRARGDGRRGGQHSADGRGDRRLFRDRRRGGRGFGTNSRDANDVKMGGNIGILLAIVLTAGVSVVVVAGARASARSPMSRVS